MVQEIRKTGKVASIQNWLDSRDPIFGGYLGLAVAPLMRISTTYLGKTKTFEGPARSYPVEQEIVNDILNYRRMCCEHSVANSGFEETSRFFRAYLFSCISVVDAFVNRYIHIAEHREINSPDIKQLKLPGRIEERLSLWLQVFGNENGKELKKGDKWSKFKILKNARNVHIHAAEPYFGYEVKKMVEPLNACRQGIGELIIVLQKAGGYDSRSLFQCLTTAPEMSFSMK